MQVQKGEFQDDVYCTGPSTGEIQLADDDLQTQFELKTETLQLPDEIIEEIIGREKTALFLYTVPGMSNVNPQLLSPEKLQNDLLSGLGEA